MLDLKDLNEDTRIKMLEEVDFDENNNNLFLSPRLNHDGVLKYPQLLKKSIKEHDVAWLINELSGDLFKSHEPRKTKSGVIQAKVPSNASQLLAEGEFNRFYCRGLCLFAIQEEKPFVEVYRAKEVSRPRIESEKKIGLQLDPNFVLNDLRDKIGDETLSEICMPNSGLSLCLPNI
ncbi:hypothetical protein [Desulfovibrio sp. UCD-KL4C]|uniref:hypothetical protein n=1 Tax=Desulfovibrio sp. UCD-KL4C TaxID=2578120 RepID=UPI0025B7F090|nr:hypothetical protein [Desulfovibrio sp. UCD-KL4C]